MVNPVCSHIHHDRRNFAQILEASKSSSCFQDLPKDVNQFEPEDESFKPSSDSENEPFKRMGAVAANSQLCVQETIKILKNGGSAADAAVVALLIEGLVNPQSMGMGGGFLLTYYDKERKVVECLNAREFAPEAAHKDMFKDLKGNYEGGLTSAVPGEIMGCWELHQKYGKLPWAQVLAPAIHYCKNGIPVTWYCGAVINRMRNKLSDIPTLKSIFTNSETNDFVKEGDLMMRPQLAKTLEAIAEKGPGALYDGELTDGFVKDVRENGGIITKEDMKTYIATWEKPFSISLPNNLSAHSIPPPGSGSVLLLILTIIFGMPETTNPELKWFRLVETWKHVFGYRCTLEGPMKGVSSCEDSYKFSSSFVEDVKRKVLSMERTRRDQEFYSMDCFSAYFGGGTCHICILDKNGNAVSVTSSINSIFGALFASKSTGIILNNHMADFNHPQKNHFKCNVIQSQKQPLSNMSPTIIINEDTGDIRLIVGAAGGTKIITATSQIIVENLLHNVTLGDAINEKRLHHQLLPMTLYYEAGFQEIEKLEKLGHSVQTLQSQTVKNLDIFVPPSSSVTAIDVEGGHVRAFGDPRRDGAG